MTRLLPPPRVVPPEAPPPEKTPLELALERRRRARAEMADADATFERVADEHTEVRARLESLWDKAQKLLDDEIRAGERCQAAANELHLAQIELIELGHRDIVERDASGALVPTCDDD